MATDRVQASKGRDCREREIWVCEKKWRRFAAVAQTLVISLTLPRELGLNKQCKIRCPTPLAPCDHDQVERSSLLSSVAHRGRGHLLPFSNEIGTN